MILPRFIVHLLLICSMVLGTRVVFSQDYPNKSIRIVTAAAGGGNDFVARQIAQGISGSLGQPVIVDNQAVGLVAAQIVSKSPPDGYVLFVAGSSHWITPLVRKVPYDPVRDFSPISLISRQVSIV